MADRYQNRPFPADDYDHGDQHGSARDDGDPLAELARLIGQTNASNPISRANHKVQPLRTPAPEPYTAPAETYDEPPAGPPAWMQRANRQANPPAVEPDELRSVHPLHRYGAQRPPLGHDQRDQDDLEETAFLEPEEHADPSRYDDALYGQIEAGAQDYQREPAYPDDPYAYQDTYDDGADEPRKRRGGMMTVVAVLMLAVVGTGAAFAYRTYVGTPRTGEPPIIKADNSPIKIVPAPSDGSAKLPDRMAVGDGAEKIVPREEAPVDVNAKVGGPRVVFPALNQNANPPTVASVAPTSVPVPTAGSAPSNGTMPNSEPRRIKTLTVRGDQPDNAAVPVAAAPAAAARPGPAAKTTSAIAPPAAPHSSAAANASANGPLSLSPQTTQPAPPETRVAAANPAQIVAPPSSNAGTAGGYMVQVSSQRSEADAQASYRALQGKFQAVLGSHSPVIKRADLGEKGVYYRAMVGPFGSPEEASQFCGNLKTAGGQCVVQRT